MDDKILIVDDEEQLLELVSAVLTREGYSVDQAAGVERALEKLEAGEYSVVVTDKNMIAGGGTEGGMLLLRHIKKHQPSLEVIVMTGYATIETAIEAMKLGAFDYLLKPFKPKDLLACVERVFAVKSFINPERALRVHKVFHEKVVRLLEQRAESDDAKLLEALKSLEESICGFLTMQKEWERIILLQQESLSQISAHAEQLRESVEAQETPSLELIDEIIEFSMKRL